MDFDWSAAAQVVAAASAAAAAIASWRAVLQVQRARREDLQDQARDEVLSCLLDLQRLAPNRLSSFGEVEVVCSRLQVRMNAIDPADREALPSALVLISPRVVSPAMVEQAVDEITLLRKR